MFKDSIIVITGGSSGLGKALAQRLVERGAYLALIARDKNKLVRVKDELSATCIASQRIEIFPCDVTDYDATEKALSTIADTFGLPDILINSAGILKEGYFEKLPLSTFREVMDINYFGVLNCTKAMIPFFKKKGLGRIVNISSLGGKIGTFGYTAYCSSKFAIEFESPMVDDLNTYRTIENRVVTHTVPALSLDVVADEVIRGIQKDRYLIIPGFIARFIEMTGRWFPSINRAIIDYQISRVYKGPEG
jgi:3-dehydrosphinganine reductase